jgi:Phosphoenolpyruvate carboxykinase
MSWQTYLAASQRGGLSCTAADLYGVTVGGPLRATLTPQANPQALAYEPGSHLVSSGALATLSGAKTGRTPKDKRVVREEDSQDDVWCVRA